MKFGVSSQLFCISHSDKLKKVWKLEFSTFPRQLLLWMEPDWKVLQAVAIVWKTLHKWARQFLFLSFVRGQLFWWGAAKRLQQGGRLWVFWFHHVGSTTEGVVEGMLLFGKIFWITQLIFTLTFLGLLVTFTFVDLQLQLTQTGGQLLVSICILSYSSYLGMMNLWSKVESSRCAFCQGEVGWGREEGLGSSKRWGEGMGGRRSRRGGREGRKGGREERRGARVLGPWLVTGWIVKTPILLKINRIFKSHLCNTVSYMCIFIPLWLQLWNVGPVGSCYLCAWESKINIKVLRKAFW